MKKSFKKIVAIFSAVAVILVFSAPVVFAADTGMKTMDFDVQVNVKEDKSAYITEKIKVRFLEPRRGIFRNIPYTGTTYEKINGKKVETNYHNKIEDITVSDYNYETYNDSGYTVVKIGEEDKTIKGIHNYTISYNYRMAADKSKNSDTLYLDLIPKDWPNAIDNTDITVNMPKSFDEDELEVFAGGIGDNINKVKWDVKGNTIHINNTQRLIAGAGTTIRLVLPEDYFEGELSYNWAITLMIVTGILAILTLVFFWFRYGRDPKHVQTVEFDPPEGVSPAEVGYIIDGISDKKDLISLIIYFAHKGYLTIEEADEKGRDFTLRKLKDLPEDSLTYELTFFNGLFDRGQGDTVDLSQLGTGFYPTFAAAQKQLADEFIKKKDKRIFALSSVRARLAAYAAAAVALLVSGLLTCVFTGSFSIMIGFAVALVLVILSYTISAKEHDKKYIRKKTTKTLTMILSIICLLAGMVATFFIIYWMTGELIPALILVLMEAVGLWATRYMQKRTRRGAEMLGKILGFKEYIKVADKARIKMMVNENPEYFYDILPYAYVLGLTKKWAKKFENIVIEPPTWYYGDYRYDTFSALVFVNSFNHYTSAMDSSIVLPSSSVEGGGGSFGGGGGFSGGGMGGGGGGSW